MRAIRRILVAIKDPAHGSLAALVKGAQLARATGASIELFHAISTPLLVSPYAGTRRSLLNTERDVRRRCLADLGKIAGRLRAKGLRATAAAEWDFPAYEAVVRRAIRVRADLVIAEPHAGRRVAPWLLHLNDWELLRLCPVPVLLVRSAGAYRRPVVLAALDPGHAFAKPADLDQEILRAAGGIAGALRGRLHAMHACMPATSAWMAGAAMNGSAIGGLQAESLAFARRGFERELAKTGISVVRRHLVEQTAIDAIPGVARRVGARIVVMGAVSRSGLKRVFIGNTAERVLDGLSCDVLVVKPPRFKCPVGRTQRGVRLAAVTQPMPY